MMIIKKKEAAPVTKQSAAPHHQVQKKQGNVIYLRPDFVDCQIPNCLHFFIPMKTYGVSFLNFIKKIEGLSIYEKSLFRELVLLAGRDGRCFPAVKTLALFASCSPRTVNNSLKSLEIKGYIRKMQRRGTSNLFFFPLKKEYFGFFGGLHEVQGGAARGAGGAARGAEGGCISCTQKNKKKGKRKDNYR